MSSGATSNLEQLEEPIRTISLMCVSFGLRMSEALALRWHASNQSGESFLRGLGMWI